MISSNFMSGKLVRNINKGLMPIRNEIPKTNAAIRPKAIDQIKPILNPGMIWCFASPMDARESDKTKIKIISKPCVKRINPIIKIEEK
ncbi:hypothetical protein GMMP15_580037 [Candidatus Magnetomoraceae bacterium gMMP-15]